MPDLSPIPTMLGQLGVGIGLLTIIFAVFIAKTWPQRRAVLLLAPWFYLFAAIFFLLATIGQDLTNRLLLAERYGIRAVLLEGLRVDGLVKGTHHTFLLSNGDRITGVDGDHFAYAGLILMAGWMLGWLAFWFGLAAPVIERVPWLARLYDSARCWMKRQADEFTPRESPALPEAPRDAKPKPKPLTKRLVLRRSKRRDG